MKSCVSTYSYFPLYQKGDFTHFDAVDHTKAIGCDGIELVLDDVTPDGSSPVDFALRFTDYARKQGLEVPIYTTSANFFVPDAEREAERLLKHIDAASQCGIPLLRHDVAWGFYEGYEGIKSYKNIIEYVAPYISRVADYAASKGVKTCSENHGSMMQDSDRMLELFMAVNNKNYGFLCDIGNFDSVDENCAKAVSKLLDFIVHVHAKDCFKRSGMSYNPGRGFNRSRSGNYRRATIFGHGDVPAFQILSVIKNSGYDGYVSLEFEGMESTFDGVNIGVENLHRMFRDLEG